MSERTIIQLVSAAPGWYAVYDCDDGEYWSPLACWALFETKTEAMFEVRIDRDIGGVDMHGEGASGSDDCADTSNFLRYDVEINKPPVVTESEESND